MPVCRAVTRANKRESVSSLLQGRDDCRMIEQMPQGSPIGGLQPRQRVEVSHVQERRETAVSVRVVASNAPSNDEPLPLECCNLWLNVQSKIRLKYTGA